jgi:acyl-CoA thioester hydrolase
MNTPNVEAVVKIKAEFYDCDPMGVVWHGNYVKYFEVARCKLLDAIDYNYVQMAESNYAWPIVDMRVKYIKPVSFNQEVLVKAVLAEHENRLKINYEISDARTGEKLTTGSTIQFAVDMHTRSTCFISPAVLLNKLSS